jgi:hypothetical protein
MSTAPTNVTGATLSRLFTLPGVLLGVFDVVNERLTDFPGDGKAEEVEVLAFLCHLAMGAFVIGMSNFKMP